MSAMADFIEEASESPEAGPVLRFSGSMTLARLGRLPDRLDALALPPSRLDLGAVERIDTVGAWLIHRLVARHDAKIVSASAAALNLIDQVSRADTPVQVRPAPLNPFARVLNEIGEATEIAFKTLLGLLSFFGAVLIASWDVLRQPSRFRLNAVIQRFELVGVKALAIIGLMSFLATDAQLRNILFWNLGSLAGATWNSLLITVPLTEASYSIEACLPTAEEAKQLGIRRSAPCLAMMRRTVSGANVASVARLVYPGTRYSFAGQFQA